MPQLDLYLLDHPRVELDGRAVRFGRRSALALLIYLACEQRAHSRDRLAALLWPDYGQQPARHNLNNSLSTLRKAVGREWFHSTRASIHLPPHPNLRIDVHEFNRLVTDRCHHNTSIRDMLGEGTSAVQICRACITELEEGLALYQDDFLAGFFVPDAVSFEDWQRTQTHTLRQQMQAVLERLGDGYAGTGHWNLAQATFQRLINMDPINERAHHLLARLHLKNGKRAMAAAAMASCIQLLAAEDLQPSEATVQLAQRIALHPAPSHEQGSLDAKAQPPTSQVNGTQAVTSMQASAAFATTADNQLIGRAHEWARLQECWNGLTHPYFVCIAGEAGIGKTHLAEELLAWAERQGGATARTRAYAAAGDLVYAPVMEWLRSDALRPGLASVDSVWLTEVARLLPELLGEHPHLPPPGSWGAAGPGQWQRHRLFEAVTRAFLATPQPKLLLIDDLQWCDGETVAWLHYLFRFAHGTNVASGAARRILIIGTVRPGEIEPDHPLMPMQLDLMRSNTLTQIDLAPLPPEQTGELAAQVAQVELDTDVVTALHRYTAGNPLFVVETLHSAEWRKTIETADRDLLSPQPHKRHPDLPARVQNVIQARLVQLSPAAQDLASLAAVIGRSFTVDLLCSASNDDEETVLRSLEELWQRHLVRSVGDQIYDFSHDRIRDAAWATISPILRSRLHQRVAAALESLHAAELDPVSARLAAHYHEGGELEQAIDAYRRAAAVAHARFANGEAVVLLYRALALLERLSATRRNQEWELDVILQLREPLMVAGGYFDQRLGALGERAMELAQDIGIRHQIWYAIRMVRVHQMMRGEYSKARSLSEQSTALLGDIQLDSLHTSSEEVDLYIDAHYHYAHVLLYQGDFVAAQAEFDKFLHRGETPIQPCLFGAKNMWILGYPAQARALACRGIVQARKQENPHMLAFATQNGARLHHFMHHLPEMRLLTDRALFFSEKYEIRLMGVLAKLFQGRLLAEAGQPQRGVAQIEAMLTELDQHAHMAFRAYFLGMLAESHACGDQLSQARDAVDQGLSVVESHGEGVWHAELLRLRGEYLLALNCPVDHVEETYRQAIAVAQRQSARSLELRATVSLARLWQQQGRVKEAFAELAHIYNWFTEGFKTHDLSEARALLATLSRANSASNTSLRLYDSDAFTKAWLHEQAPLEHKSQRP